VNLEFLVLWFNQISELSPLQDLINLKHLFLSDNKISDISPLKNLVNLKTIDLIDNFIPLQQIEELKKALPNCRISCNSTTIKL
jgi:Leucine-rich repeat (LRR) protein